MPFLTDEFGIMPWHISGEPSLSYLEIQEYISYYEKKKKAEKAANQQSSRSPKR